MSVCVGVGFVGVLRVVGVFVAGVFTTIYLSHFSRELLNLDREEY